MHRARYVHTNIVAHDWRKLSRFYQTVFGCSEKPPVRNLKGLWIDTLTSLTGAHIEGIHLLLPGHGKAGPTLEIFKYNTNARSVGARINRPGLGHIAFAVDDVRAVLAHVLECGGSKVGDVVEARVEGVGEICVVYARDPEGNIIELQRWS
jgi:predicted enzyme related to lactoylglutathione lyase